MLDWKSLKNTKTVSGSSQNGSPMFYYNQRPVHSICGPVARFGSHGLVWWLTFSMRIFSLRKLLLKQNPENLFCKINQHQYLGKWNRNSLTWKVHWGVIIYPRQYSANSCLRPGMPFDSNLSWRKWFTTIWALNTENTTTKIDVLICGNVYPWCYPSNSTLSLTSFSSKTNPNHP